MESEKLESKLKKKPPAKAKAKPKAKAKAKRPRKPRSKKKKSEHYVNSKEFKAALVQYYDDEDMTQYLGEVVYKISVGLSYAPNFINYTYKEDMIGDAVLKMLAAIREKKFDITSEYNPFSYFTTIAFHAFVNRIKKEKRYRETIDNYQQEVYTQQLNSSDSPSIYTGTENNDGQSDGQYNE